MATITAQSLIDRAATILQDTTNTRWPENELLDWLNDGQREVVLYKPDAHPVLEEVSMEVGTRQVIPASGMQLLDVIRNTNNGTPGSAVRLIERRVLDEQLPDWHSSAQVKEVDHFLFDERNPRHFWVYPASDGSGGLEILYASAPVDISASDTLLIDDIYANAILDYVLYRAYQKDADYAANDQRSNNQYNRFLSSVGSLDKRESVGNPYIRRTRPVVSGGGE